MREEDLYETARKIQKIHYQLLGQESYDLIPRNRLHKFQEILAHYIDKDEAKKISSKVIRRDFDLIYRILIVNCVVDDCLINFPVIRVLENNRIVFYDHCCRQYSNWENFLRNNKFPGGLLIYPKDGSYRQTNGELELETKKSPAASTSNKVDKYLYTAAEVVGSICIVLPVFSFARPYATSIKVASGVSQGYKAGHHTYQLYDRYKHGQSIDLSDEKAIMHWSHIGNNFLSFAFTCGRFSHGNPSPEDDISNVINLITMLHKEWDHENIAGSVSIINGHMLSQHMLDFNSNALTMFGFEVDVKELVFKLRNFLSDEKRTSFRKLIYVDERALTQVLQDIRNCHDVHDIRYHWYELAKEMERETVEKIEEEVDAWKRQNISKNQLQFRVDEICKNGYKTYETLSELCLYYNVDTLENVVINNKPIFQNVGARIVELENLVQLASKKYPQLLLYAVEYASKNNTVDWDMFKPYFREKLMEENNNFPTIAKRSNISWINAMTSEEVNISRTIPENHIDFIRPSWDSDTVYTQDLINLGKRLLGILTVSSLEMLIANPLTSWIVMISKARQRVIFIGPKIRMENNSLSNSYPVFIRPF